MQNKTLVTEFDEKKIDEIFAELDQCHLPGAAVGIAIDGKPVYRKGFGLANMELPVSLSPSMRIRIGSTSKHFTCLAYMLLCEDGKAGIDDPLGKHLPELHPITHKVTMRQIMGNISGLHDSMGIRGALCGHAGFGLRLVPTEEILALYRHIDHVSTAPGTTYSYNNGGFGLVTAVIERISGKTFQQFMWERVFEPLGMYDSLVRPWDTDFVPNSAAGHDIHCSRGWGKASFGFCYEGAGVIVSTADDMLRWLANWDSHKVGNAATWKVMQTPQTVASGTSTNYGLGLDITPYRGVGTIHHGGGYVGFATQMLKVPAAKLDVVVMANRDDAKSGLLVEKVLDVCIPSLGPVKTEEPYDGPPVTGIFQSPASGRVIKLFIQDGQQYVFINGPAFQAERDENGALSAFGYAITVVGKPTKPTGLRFNDFGNIDELEPAELVSVPDVSAIIGRYRLATTGIEATITKAEDGAWMMVAGPFGSKEFYLECLAKGIWKPTSRLVDAFAPGVMVFDPENAGFRFSDLFNWGLPFTRA